MDNNFDVIIAGSGVSGLYTAINLDKRLKVLLISKKDLTLNNSWLAQGGISSVYDFSVDTFESHFEDTLIAGGYKNDRKSLDVLVKSAPDEINKLISLGVDFDKNENGTYDLTLEGGHKHHRILHYKDATGMEMVRKLLEAVKNLSNVTIMENTMMFDLKKTSNGFSALLYCDGKTFTVNSRYCVLATGGIGRIYARTTNSAICTGDGITLAYNMGAEIKHLNWIQMHPTAFSKPNSRECFLISESVRGEGAYLLNCKGERFMHKYDERLELAPRDVVSHYIMVEAKETGSNNFYIDFTASDSEFVKNRFPKIYKNLLAEGYDLTKDWVPVFPCQHYLMGGINVDINAYTGIDGLYAVGECSHTGVHGNNRLASNSLLEAVVFSHRGADDINEKARDNFDISTLEEFKFDNNGTQLVPKGIRTEIRGIMQKCYFVIKNIDEIPNGLKRVTEIKEMLEKENYILNPDFIEAKSIATTAYIVLKTAMEEETLGKETN